MSACKERGCLSNTSDIATQIACCCHANNLLLLAAPAAPCLLPQCQCVAVYGKCDKCTNPEMYNYCQYGCDSNCDCKPRPRCKDGTCDLRAGEHCGNCPEDCGQCKVKQFQGTKCTKRSYTPINPMQACGPGYDKLALTCWQRCDSVGFINEGMRDCGAASVAECAYNQATCVDSPRILTWEWLSSYSSEPAGSAPVLSVALQTGAAIARLAVFAQNLCPNP